jgi:D-alanyl-lipoteichoic acid acyltransferase DltB (MBOAT superfamily)
MLASTVVSYFAAIIIEKIELGGSDRKIKEQGKSAVLIISILIHLSILFFFKYFNFLNDSIHVFFTSLDLTWNIQNFDLLLPVGISFYTFEVISYTMDVYRGKAPVEYNFGKYALFVSFFPKLVAGPIERATHLLPQFHLPQKFDYGNFQSGLMLILWGLFQKIMIADRLAILVNTVFNNVTSYQGFQYMIAIVFFSFQILCDFSAYSDIAIGASKILGFDLLKNFERPYFSKSIKEFWRRWHMSLSSWFKDYLYFPLGGSKEGKMKTYRNILIVFIVSGLWHGANWTFFVWGALHGCYQVLGMIFNNFNNRLAEKLSIKDPFSLKIVNVMVTFSLVAFAWIFFRANSIGDAIYVVKHLLVFNPEMVLTDELYKLGLDASEFRIAVLLITLLLIVNYLQRSIKLRENIMQWWLPIRWSVYISAIIAILVYGIYGNTYDASQFIYFQF